MKQERIEIYEKIRVHFLQMAPPIVISEVNGNTVISWDGGSQIVPNIVSVFGGGNGGNYEYSQITMESGAIGTLDSGTSNGSPITIENENYNVTATDSVKITNDNIDDSKKSISYDFTVSTKTVKIIIIIIY